MGRGSNRKQLTTHSKLNDGCDGNALHNSVQHKNENADGWSGHGGEEAEGQWIMRNALQDMKITCNIKKVLLIKMKIINIILSITNMTHMKRQFMYNNDIYLPI